MRRLRASTPAVSSTCGADGDLAVRPHDRARRAWRSARPGVGAAASSASSSVSTTYTSPRSASTAGADAVVARRARRADARRLAASSSVAGARADERHERDVARVVLREQRQRCCAARGGVLDEQAEQVARRAPLDERSRCSGVDRDEVGERADEPGSSLLLRRAPTPAPATRVVERAVDLLEAADLGARIAVSASRALVELAAARVEHADALVDVGVGERDLLARARELPPRAARGVVRRAGERRHGGALRCSRPSRRARRAAPPRARTRRAPARPWRARRGRRRAPCARGGSPR